MPNTAETINSTRQPFTLNPPSPLRSLTTKYKAELQQQVEAYKQKHGITGSLPVDQFNNMQAEQRALHKKDQPGINFVNIIRFIANLGKKHK